MVFPVPGSVEVPDGFDGVVLQVDQLRLHSQILIPDTSKLLLRLYLMYLISKKREIISKR